jgi:hypothetical protein
VLLLQAEIVYPFELSLPNLDANASAKCSLGYRLLTVQVMGVRGFVLNGDKMARHSE